MIRGRINVNKIDNSKLVEGRNGAKYVNVVLIETPSDKFGNDYMIVQETSKEERDGGIRSAILGNAKIMRPGKPHKPAGNESDEPPPF